MASPARRIHRLGSRLALFGLVVMTGCTMRPFEVKEPDEARDFVAPYRAAAGERGPHDYDPDPRPISLCYSTQLNTQEEVVARARSLCPNNGPLRYFSEDSVVNGCGLLQPNRVTFICTPGPQPPSPYE